MLKFYLASPYVNRSFSVLTALSLEYVLIHF